MVIDINHILLIKIEDDLQEAVNSGDPREEVEKRIRMQLSIYQRILNAEVIKELHG